MSRDADAGSSSVSGLLLAFLRFFTASSRPLWRAMLSRCSPAGRIEACVGGPRTLRNERQRVSRERTRKTAREAVGQSGVEDARVEAPFQQRLGLQAEPLKAVCLPQPLLALALRLSERLLLIFEQRRYLLRSASFSRRH